MPDAFDRAVIQDLARGQGVFLVRAPVQQGADLAADIREHDLLPVWRPHAEEPTRWDFSQGRHRHKSSRCRHRYCPGGAPSGALVPGALVPGALVPGAELIAARNACQANVAHFTRIGN
jgi:hypothetical protein